MIRGSGKSPDNLQRYSRALYIPWHCRHEADRYLSPGADSIRIEENHYYNRAWLPEVATDGAVPGGCDHQGDQHHLFKTNQRRPGSGAAGNES